jgi:hypothetical protein
MRRYLIILLTLITAVIHFYFWYDYVIVQGEKILLFQSFLLNAIGYLGLLGLLYLPLGLPNSIHRYVRPLFIAYTALTIVLYIYFSATSGAWSVPLAPIAKIDEAILIWQLWAEGRAEMPATTASRKSDAML